MLWVVWNYDILESSAFWASEILSIITIISRDRNFWNYYYYTELDMHAANLAVLFHKMS